MGYSDVLLVSCLRNTNKIFLEICPTLASDYFRQKKSYKMLCKLSSIITSSLFVVVCQK